MLFLILWPIILLVLIIYQCSNKNVFTRQLLSHSVQYVALEKYAETINPTLNVVECTCTQLLVKTAAMRGDSFDQNFISPLKQMGSV